MVKNNKSLTIKIIIITIWTLCFALLMSLGGPGNGWRKAIAIYVLPVILVVALLLSPRSKKTKEGRNFLSPEIKVKRYGIANLVLGIITLLNFIYLMMNQRPDSAAGFVFVLVYVPLLATVAAISSVLSILTQKLKHKYKDIPKKYTLMVNIGLSLLILQIVVVVSIVLKFVIH